MKKPNVVVLGGGTGLSVLLKGLKHFPVEITAVVTVADDGGSTGILRNEFNIPAMGDIRNVLVALSEKEQIFEQLIQYRFETENALNGHPIGNLMLTALLNMSGSTVEAVKSLAQVLNVKGKVLPATNGNDTLIAHLKDGSIIEGESKIKHARSPIDFVTYKEEPAPVAEVVEAIKEADMIVFGMGSLYTSVIPNILPDETRHAIIASNAKKVYVCNAMTEKGETDNYHVSNYIDALVKHLGCNCIDHVIVNDEEIPEEIKEAYLKEDAVPVMIDEERLISHYNIDVIQSRIVQFNNNLVRHDSIKLAATIFSLLID